MPYLSEILTDSPSVVLKLDDTAEPYLDSSGNNHLQTTTPTITANQPGISSEITASALFAGGRIDEDFGSTTGYTAVTVEAWYKSTNGNGTLWTSRGVSGNGLTLFIGVTGAGFGAAGQISWGLDGPLYQGVSTTSTWHDGAWHHIVGVFSRASGTIVPADFSIYVDGALQTVTQRTINGSATVPITPSRNWTIGQHPAGWGNGTLSNTYLGVMAIYPVALSSPRINAHYTAMNLPPATSALVNSSADIMTVSSALPVALVQTTSEVLTVPTDVPVALVQTNVEALSLPDIVPVALVNTYAEVMTRLLPTNSFSGWGTPL